VLASFGDGFVVALLLMLSLALVHVVCPIWCGEPRQNGLCDAVNAAAPVRKFVAGPDAQRGACIGATDAHALPIALVNTIAGDKVAHHHFVPRERIFCRAATASINHCRRLDCKMSAASARGLSAVCFPAPSIFFGGTR